MKMGPPSPQILQSRSRHRLLDIQAVPRQEIICLLTPLIHLRMYHRIRWTGSHVACIYRTVILDRNCARQSPTSSAETKCAHVEFQATSGFGTVESIISGLGTEMRRNGRGLCSMIS